VFNSDVGVLRIKSFNHYFSKFTFSLYFN